jgi:hypothetical protein
MVTATVAFALPHTGKWEQQVFNPTQATSGVSNFSVAELCPATPDFSFTGLDPSGDTFSLGSDIVSVSGIGDASTFCLTVTFAGPVDPADAGTGQEVVGFIEFDTDADLTTGFFGNVDVFCPNLAGIGVEAALDMFSLSGGFATIFPSGDLVPVIFDQNSFTAVIPLSAIGSDNIVNFAMVLGSFAEPTDCAPNGGSIHSPDGTIVPIPAIGSISGRVVDAQTRVPLQGDASPFASVELRHCFDSECSAFNTVNSQSTDSGGRFLFRSDFSGNPLIVGTYQVATFADQFQSGQTVPFSVGEGEDRDVGDIPLQPSPIQSSEIRPCGDLPPEGGQCRYSVRIHNRQTGPFQGAAWSIVESGDIGSFTGFTRFQPQRPRHITLDPEESRVVHFNFEIPSTVRNGALICAQVFAGQGTEPFFDTVGQRDLFCVLKGFTGGFSVLSEEEVKKLRQQVDERSVILPTQQGPQGQAPKKIR